MSEAERILGKPESTIRRWIREGRVTGEQVPRDPANPRDTRTVWQVLVTDSPAPATPSESPQAPETRHEPSAAVTGFLERLTVADEQIAAKDEAIRQQAETIGELRERVGRAEARAELESARATDLAQRLERAEADLDAERAEVRRLLDRISGRRWWRPSTW